MLDANNISARSYMRDIPSGGCFQNHFNTVIQTPYTFENRNVIRYNLRILTRIFSG